MYEFLVATGRADGASTNYTVEMALIYLKDGKEVISDYFRPMAGNNSPLHGNAYQNGQMDAVWNLEIKKDGEKVDTEDFIGVMIKFYDKTWQLDTIWVTHQNGGRCGWKKVNKFLGSKNGLGTPDNPYRVDLESETVDNTLRLYDSFSMNIKTASGKYDGTDDNVYFKLFDDTGHTSVTQRAHLPFIDQYEPGQTDMIPSFQTQYGKLSKNIIKILIVKKGNDGWKPEYIMVNSGLGDAGHKRHFDAIYHLPPGEQSLDTHHNWTVVPERDFESATKTLQTELTQQIR